MALTNLVKLPKSVCKHVKIYPPTAVICFAHSQLAALDQACNVSRKKLNCTYYYFLLFFHRISVGCELVNIFCLSIAVIYLGIS